MNFIHLDRRIEVLDIFSDFLLKFINKSENKIEFNDNENILSQAIIKSRENNSLFIEQFVLTALKSWADILNKESLKNWLSPYSISDYNKNPKKIAVVMAGNIPIVGMHDFISVLVTGNIFLGKCSSKDKYLIKAIADILCKIEPQFAEYIHFEDHIVKDFDGIIVTGSNNTANYFEKYIGKYPSIIRKNMNSVAIISPDDKDEEISKLADDIFLYFGLGCRNVSKIYIPSEDFIQRFVNLFDKYKEIMLNSNTYMNNYDYQKALLIMNLTPFYDFVYFIMVENKSQNTPISVVNYEIYDDINKITNEIRNNDSIQCVISNKNIGINTIEFGKGQFPALNDYADNIDTIKFLLSIQ